MNTAPRTVSDEVFAESWCRLQSAVLVARELGLQERGVHKRRRNYEAKHGKILKASSPNSPSFYMREHQARADCRTAALSSDLTCTSGRAPTRSRRMRFSR